MDDVRLRYAAHMTLLVCLLFAFALDSHATTAEDKVIKASATVQESPAQITLNWPATAGTENIVIYRKTKADGTNWGLSVATLASTATSWIDTTVAVGTAYEYKLHKDVPLDPFPRGQFGYVQAGIKVPLVEDRGKIVLIVDSTFTASLATELARLEEDLVGDGWTVLRHDVSPAETVPYVKGLIVSDCTAVFLFGNLPVPYSGDIAPDSHAEHQGAWPADLFYGDVDGTWTDSTVARIGAARSENDNIPGDGKYDQSTIPSFIDLMVGRVDLAGMTAFSSSEEDLLRQYLDKDHAFRHGVTTVQARALVDDELTGLTEGPAQNGWRFAALVGAANVTAGDWSTLTTNDYLLAYGCGTATYTGVNGVASTSDYVSSTYQAIFQMFFGSYFGDWDNTNNMLRAPLCNPTYGLTSCWAARPNWQIHHMGLGDPIGYGFLMSTLGTVYSTSYHSYSVHVALMGDPTLRLHNVPPASALNASQPGANVDLSWTASPGPGILGYNVYRATDPGGPYTRLNGALVAGTSYSDTSPLAGNTTYMVRAVRLEQSSTGTYYNGSQGIFKSMATVPVELSRFAVE